MPRCSYLLSLPLALLPSVLPSGEAESWGVAPDGRAGFGASPDLQRVAGLFRKADGDDEEFLGDLGRLTSDVRLLIASVRMGWAQRGYLELLSHSQDDGDLALCYERWRRMASGPFDEAWDEERARAFAWFAADTRAWARKDLMARAEKELEELRAGLAILAGHAFGKVSMQPGFEFELVARRTDLAAALARAIRSDLTALAEPIFAPPSYGREVEDLVRALMIGDESAAEELRYVVEHRELLVNRMTYDLRTTRLLRSAKGELEARERGRRLAGRALRAVRVMMPTTREGRSPTPVVAAMKQSERYRRVVSSGLEGLSGDPFHAELNYFVAEGYQFIEGELFADAYYDRFLVLSGIRYYDQTTFRDRYLSYPIERALFFVADLAVNGDPRLRDRDGDGLVDQE